MKNSPDGLILLPRLKVINANAISGPLSWGFPAPSAFTGFVHALQRKIGEGIIQTEDLDLDGKLELDGVGIICHKFDPQVNKSQGTYRYRFNLSKNPVGDRKKIGKDGQLVGASFVEEGRTHFEVSLLIGVTGYLDQEDGEIFAGRLAQVVQFMRLAGGSILPISLGKKYCPKHYRLSGNQEGDRKVFKGLRRHLLPGFALIHRHDLLMDHLQDMCTNNAEATVLDALFDLVQLKWEPEISGADENEKVKWRAKRAKPGWLVPVPVGYGPISELFEPGEVKNARDNDTPFRFVESLCSLGEWRSPHRIEVTQDLLWYHRAEPDLGLYICDHKKMV